MILSIDKCISIRVFDCLIVALDYSGYSDAGVLTLAAQIHTARQQHAKALEFAERAMKLDPEVC